MTGLRTVQESSVMNLQQRTPAPVSSINRIPDYGPPEIPDTIRQTGSTCSSRTGTTIFIGTCSRSFMMRLIKGAAMIWQSAKGRGLKNRMKMFPPQSTSSLPKSIRMISSNAYLRTTMVLGATPFHIMSGTNSFGGALLNLTGTIHIRSHKTETF